MATENSALRSDGAGVRAQDWGLGHVSINRSTYGGRKGAADTVAWTAFVPTPLQKGSIPQDAEHPMMAHTTPSIPHEPIMIAAAALPKHSADPTDLITALVAFEIFALHSTSPPCGCLKMPGTS